MRAINVWAWQEQLTNAGPLQRVPICSDASQSTRRMGPAGRWVREAGWHLAVPFSDLADLAAKLRETELPEYIRGDQRRLQRGEVQKLAIDTHGMDGFFYPEGLPGVAVGAAQLNDLGTALRDIGLMTASQEHSALVPNPPWMQQTTVQASTIILMGCNTGAGERGTELLRQLSFRWPNRRVVGFSTTVVIPNLQQVQDPVSGEACVPPFSLDSGQHGMRRAESDAWIAEFSSTPRTNPQLMPLADATAENAKIARDGRIIHRPANERRRASLGPQLTGPPRGNTARPTIRRESGRRIV